MNKIHSNIAGGILSVFLILQAPAASFVAPEEGGCSLRIDRIPLDTDTMSDLSDGLATISQAPVDGLPARHRRSSAQALALALALDPANDTARNALSAFTHDKPLAMPTPEKLIQAKALAWQLHGWLSTPEAGEDGRQLAGLIGDSLRFLDPEHPSAVALKNSPETGNWSGWVADLDSFKSTRNNDTPEKPAKSDFDPFDGMEENTPKKEDEKPASGGAQIQLTEAAIKTYLYEKAEGSEKYSMQPVNVSMKARKTNEGEEGFFVEIEANEEHDKIRDLVAKPIYEALKASLENKPAPGRIRLTAGNKSYRYRSNTDNLTGPGFVLASAAMSGNAPVGTVIARLSDDGKLQAPIEFWNILRSMTEGKETGRLIIPASAEKYMTGLLTMEQKSFFLRYEVLLASSPAEMIALSSSKPSEKHAAAFAKFAEIRQKSEGISTGVYVANRFVLQRLEELSAEAPYHLSAKLLAMQGAGKRPRALTREILAAELLRVIEPVYPFTQYNMPDVKKETRSRMDDISKECRDAIDNLERITDIRDRDLLEAGRNMTTALRALSRELGKSGDYWNRSNDIEKAKKELVSLNTALRTGLSKISGVPLPEHRNP
ncbi:MAG: hypothetical protein ABJQ29_12180 [Luteolibacter sp.]